MPGDSRRGTHQEAPEMRVLLDTNVILDLMLERDPWRAEAEAIAEADVDGRLQAHACASSITDLFYISRKLVGAEGDGSTGHPAQLKLLLLPHRQQVVGSLLAD